MRHNLIFESWNKTESCINGTEDILEWVACLNKSTFVSIEKIGLSDCEPWYYNKESGIIQNQKGTFFKISGLRFSDAEQIIEQPIILQHEIGFLGFICKEINGVLYFLVQAKIEPGNINHIQLSPTIQATKSNFTQKHGGKIPLYLEYFLNIGESRIIVDQIQSEQSSRFLKKRNRNIIIMLKDSEEIICSPNHKWMTLGQIKAFMKYENLVNMDTRTVLSCIPYADYCGKEAEILFNDKSLFLSLACNGAEESIARVYHYINNYKMFSDAKSDLIPIHELKDWDMSDCEIACKSSTPFKIIFCDIKVEGREVTHWKQPLFEAVGKAYFGLFCVSDNGIKEFLVKAQPEIGCFDGIEIGPTLQIEADFREDSLDEIEKLFLNMYRQNKGVKYNIILSEEGGRFYHEQNHNIIIEINTNFTKRLPPGYFWMSYKALGHLLRVNNCLNIQLRNLLSLLEA